MAKRVIPPFRLRPEPLSDEAAALPGFKWAAKEVGARHRLGGEPEFLQAEEWPHCTECKNEMTFYGQLDSLNDEFVLADCGLIYVFICFDCFETKCVLHSY